MKLKLKVWKQPKEEGECRNFKCQLKVEVPSVLEPQMKEFETKRGKRPPQELALSARKSYKRIILAEEYLWNEDIRYEKRTKKTNKELYLEFSFEIKVPNGSDSDSVIISCIKQDITDALTVSL